MRPRARKPKDCIQATWLEGATEERIDKSPPNPTSERSPADMMLHYKENTPDFFPEELVVTPLDDCQECFSWRIKDELFCASDRRLERVPL